MFSTFRLCLSATRLLFIDVCDDEIDVLACTPSVLNFSTKAVRRMYTLRYERMFRELQAKIPGRRVTQEEVKEALRVEAEEKIRIKSRRILLGKCMKSW